jgi:hypothetical protein
MLARPHLAALGVVLCLVGAALLLVELRDPAPSAAPGPAPRVGQPAHDGELAWPPVLDQPYPPLVLLGTDDQWHAIAELKGRPVLIQVIGMNCPACNAWAGAGDDPTLGFRGVVPQTGLGALRDDLQRYAGGLALDDPRFTVVHLLLYDMALRAPSVADARAWAEHFGIDQLKNHLVLVGGERLVCPASYAMVPGFQLLDRDLVLRRDATGHQPRHDLYRDLLPELARMLGVAEQPPTASAGGPPDSGISVTVDDAYAAIKHRREPLDLAGIPDAERDGLQLLLRALDEAVRLKIALWWACSAGEGDKAATLLERLDTLRSWLEHAPVPAGLDAYRRDLVEGLAAQRAFFDDWRAKGKSYSPAGISSHPQAQACSRAVHAAYEELLRRYPQASAHDRQVFYDRHCAFDLI